MKDIPLEAGGLHLLRIIIQLDMTAIMDNSLKKNIVFFYHNLVTEAYAGKCL